MIRGGRLIKWKGRAASLSPILGALTGSVSSLAVVALAGGQVLLSTGGAWAGTCVEGSPGVWTCSGAAANPGDVTQTLGSDATGPLSVTTTPGFGIDVAIGSAFDLRSNAGITFTDANASAITGAYRGIDARNDGSGALSITATGDVTGTNFYGIYARNFAAGTDLTISAADVSGGTFGISARNDGTGALDITATGDVTGAAYNGIQARNSAAGTDLTISAAGVTGGVNGIVARNYGTGALGITTTGEVEGTSGTGIYARNNAAGTALTISAAGVTGGEFGIFARNYGTGALEITTTGDFEGMVYGGIRAVNHGTDLTISAAGVTGGVIGIYALNSGSGRLDITATGDVTTTGFAGIFATNLGTDFTISAAGVTGTFRGIQARNAGTGALSITTTGDVTATISAGVYASNYGTDLTILAAGVTGGANGINARNYGTGALSITTTGDVAGSSNTGIYARNSAAGTDLTISTATVTGGYTGIDARNFGTGTLGITATGDVEGTNRAGIFASNSGNGPDLTISAAGVTGGVWGIFAENVTGTLGVTATGDVVGTNASGIYLRNIGTDITISAAGVTGGTFGVNVINYGTGALGVTATGDVTGTTNIGIYARNSDNGTDLTISAAGVITGGGNGISASNYGTGALDVTATGDVAGTGGTGIIARNSGTDLTIMAADVTGGAGGYAAILGENLGSGALNITTTGDVVGAGPFGILALNEGTDLTITAANVSGSDDGIYALNYGSGAVRITTTGEVVGITGVGIDVFSSRNSLVDIAGLVIGGSGIAIDMTEVDGNATLALRPGWGLDGQALGSATLGDRLHLTGTGVSALDLGQIGDAGDPNAILGFERFLKTGSSVWMLTGTQADDGFLAAELRGGRLILDDATFLMDPAGTGLLEVSGRGILQAQGAPVVAGDLLNAGAVSMVNGAATDSLTVAGDYTGDGGRLLLETVLGDDASATDRLVVDGDVAGQTALFVENLGGTGGQTASGILVVEVGGTSGEDAFALGAWDFTTAEGDRALIAGAFGYVLQSEDGNWLLSSALRPVDPDDPDDDGPIYQPGVPVYEAFAAVSGNHLRFASLEQRTLGAVRGEAPAEFNRGVVFDAGAGSWDLQTGFWARVEGARDNVSPISSTTSTTTSSDRFMLELGADRALDFVAQGDLIGSVNLRYTTARTDVSSPFGNGRIDSAGYGIGGGLTWYLPDGLYLDGQAQLVWLESDLSSRQLGTLAEGTDGFGYGLSVEVGKVIPLAGPWTITPQAQLSYARTALDAFTDGFGVTVTPEDVESRQLRLGVTAGYEDVWRAGDGTLRNSSLQIGLDLFHEGFPETLVDVSGTEIRSERDALRGEISLRGAYSWDDDRYSVFGELAAGTGLNAFGDSDTTRVTIGFQSQW